MYVETYTHLSLQWHVLEIGSDENWRRGSCALSVLGLALAAGVESFFSGDRGAGEVRAAMRGADIAPFLHVSMCVRLSGLLTIQSYQWKDRWIHG